MTDFFGGLFFLKKFHEIIIVRRRGGSNSELQSKIKSERVFETEKSGTTATVTTFWGPSKRHIYNGSTNQE